MDLLQFWDSLNEDEKRKLKKQIHSLPLAKMQRIYINSYHDDVIEAKKIKPLKTSNNCFSFNDFTSPLNNAFDILIAF